MDARKLEQNVIREMIEEGEFLLTGITNYGEVVVTIMPNVDKEILKENITSEMSKKEKKRIIKKFMKTKGRPAKEFMQVYLQEVAPKRKRCKKNWLRSR